jgi:hypothetical protein
VDIEDIAPQGGMGGLVPGASVMVRIRPGGAAANRGTTAAPAGAAVLDGAAVCCCADFGGTELWLSCRARLDSTVDVEYYKNGGVLPRVLRLKLREQRADGLARRDGSGHHR